MLMLDFLTFEKVLQATEMVSSEDGKGEWLAALHEQGLRLRRSEHRHSQLAGEGRGVTEDVLIGVFLG